MWQNRVGTRMVSCMWNYDYQVTKTRKAYVKLHVTGDQKLSAMARNATQGRLYNNLIDLTFQFGYLERMFSASSVSRCCWWHPLGITLKFDSSYRLQHSVLPFTCLVIAELAFRLRRSGVDLKSMSGRCLILSAEHWIVVLTYLSTQLHVNS